MHLHSSCTVHTIATLSCPVVRLAVVQMQYCKAVCGRILRAVTTARDISEPSWHRRARRQRAQARTLLRLEAARERLQRHHSAQMAPKNYWICKLVSSEHDGTWPNKLCNGTNFMANTHCRFCEGLRPPWANKKAADGTNNGKGKGKSGQTDCPNNGAKGKGKGKGKHLGKSANQDSKPELLDKGVWNALTKDQKRRYRSSQLAKQDAIQLAKLANTNGPSRLANVNDDEAMEEEMADEEETDVALTKRDFQVSLSGYFDKIVEPRPQTKERSAEEALCALLTKGARASAEAAEKTQRISALNSAIAATTCKFAKVALMEKMEELQKQLDEINSDGGDHASAATEKMAYCKARDKLDNDRENKREYREKKTVEMEQNSHVFLAAVAEVKAQLSQLESEFLQRRNAAREKWSLTNAESDKLADEMRTIACARIEAAEKKIADKKAPVRTIAETSADAAATTIALVGGTTNDVSASATAATAAAAAAMEETRIRENVVRQLETRKEVHQEHLRCFKEKPLTSGELPTAHLMWNWAKGVEFEDPMLPYTYTMIGVTGEDLTVFLGKTATDILFTMANSPMDIVPMQVRGLIAYQLRMLEQQKTLCTTDSTPYEEQETKAKASLKKHLPALRESRRSGMRHVKK